MSEAVVHRLISEEDRSEEELLKAITAAIEISCRGRIYGTSVGLIEYGKKEPSTTFARLNGQSSPAYDTNNLLMIEYAFDTNGRLRVLFSSIDEFNKAPDKRPVLWDSDTGKNENGEEVETDTRTAITNQMLELTGQLNALIVLSEARERQTPLVRIDENSLAGKIAYLQNSRPTRTYPEIRELPIL